jgi:hypothetical protein
MGDILLRQRRKINNLLIYSSDDSCRPLGDIADFRNHLLQHKVMYLMVTPMRYYSEAPHFFSLMSPFTQRYRGIMEPVYMTKDSSSQIWEIDQEKPAHSEQ